MAEDIEPLLTIEEVAAIYRVKPRTVEGWIQRGVGPEVTRTPSGGRRFKVSDVRADLAKRGAAA